MIFVTRISLVRAVFLVACAMASASAFAFSFNGVSIGMSRQDYQSKYSNESCQALKKDEFHCFYVASILVDPIPKGLGSYGNIPIDVLTISFRKDSICEIALKVEGKYSDLFIKALTKELGEPRPTTFPRFKSLDWSQAEYVAGLTVIESQGFVHFSARGRKCLPADE